VKKLRLALAVAAVLAAAPSAFAQRTSASADTTAPAPVGDATVPYGPEGLEGDY